MNVSSGREERLRDLQRDVQRAEHMAQALMSLSQSIAQSPAPVGSYGPIWAKVADRLAADARRVYSEADPWRQRIVDITAQIERLREGTEANWTETAGMGASRRGAEIGAPTRN